MKNIFVTLLLVTILAFSMVSALSYGLKASTDSNIGENVSADATANAQAELPDRDIKAADVDAATSELREHANPLRKVGSAWVTQSTGWIANSQQAYLVAGVWVTQQIGQYNGTENFTGTLSTRGFGRLKISENANYKLAKDNTGGDENGFKFYVLPTDADAQADDVANMSLGTLYVTKRNSYTSGVTIWGGSLTMNSGDLKGTWILTLVSDNKPAGNGEKTEVAQNKTEKRGFWSRLFGLK